MNITQSVKSLKGRLGVVFRFSSVRENGVIPFAYMPTNSSAGFIVLMNNSDAKNFPTNLYADDMPFKMTQAVRCANLPISDLLADDWTFHVFENKKPTDTAPKTGHGKIKMTFDKSKKNTLPSAVTPSEGK